MKYILATGAGLAALLLSGCAATTPATDAAAAPSTPALSPEDQLNFFVSDARNGHVDAVKAGVDAGLPVNGKDSLGQTALLAAVSHNELEEVQLLLAHGADPNIPDDAGWTSLHYAAWFGSGVDVLASLRDHGATINAQNDRGITPLYFASVAGHTAQVKYLLDQGADRAIASKSGYTPLRAAKTKGLDGIVALLDPDAAKAAAATPVKGAH
jgi:ankyrin repeat protein